MDAKRSSHTSHVSNSHISFTRSPSFQIAKAIQSPHNWFTIAVCD